MARHKLDVADERLLAVAQARVGPLQDLGVDPLLQLPLGDALRVTQSVVSVAAGYKLLHGPVDFTGRETRQARVGLHGRQVARHGGATAEGGWLPPGGRGAGFA